MTLLDRIPSGTLVAVDTAPWIYAFEINPRYEPILRPLFDLRFATGLNRAGASALVVAEILTHPISLGRHDLVATYRHFFQDAGRVAVWTVDNSVAERAATLRVKYRLKLIDALHVAAAIENTAAVFVRNDVELRRVTEIPVLVLDDFLLQMNAP